MHRHGYQGRKFGRRRDQRRALLRGLALGLFEHGAITTTLPKAKELRPFAEKLITKARRGGLSNRRAVYAALGNNIEIGNRLLDNIAGQMQRDSGYLRIEKSGYRVGDNADMATISFVDELSFDEVQGETETTPETVTTDAKPAAKTAAKGAKS
jgi:large subunit ribosomal protein L17